jgi:hypothetical protein
MHGEPAEAAIENPDHRMNLMVAQAAGGAVQCVIA